MILSRKEILKLVKKGKIIVEPFNQENIGPCSLDLTLSNEFALPSKGKILISEDIDLDKHLKKKTFQELELKPNDFVLGITQEKITLPQDVAGFLSGRSRFARVGLQVHAASSLIQPCISNKQIFEIKNIGKNTLILKPGAKVGQVIFLKVKGKTDYQGKFKLQEKIV
jgi:dCTP deaminase